MVPLYRSNFHHNIESLSQISLAEPLMLFAKIPHRNKGQTVVEVALIFPLLVLLVGAAIDWGLLLFVSHIVQNAVQEGARWAVTRADIKQSEIMTQVNDKIPETPLFEEFRNSVSVSCAVSGGKPFIIVQANGTFRYNFMSLIGFNATTITRRARMQYERSAAICPTIA
jgi:hypothetical protein